MSSPSSKDPPARLERRCEHGGASNASPRGGRLTASRADQAHGVFLPRSAGGAADILIDAELRQQLQWEVPDYKQEATTAAVMGAVSGGLGALVYGATPTDVHGHARVVLRVKRVTGEELLVREYAATATERMSKLSSDTHATKAKMVAQSLLRLMNDIRADIATAFTPSAQ